MESLLPALLGAIGTIVTAGLGIGGFLLTRGEQAGRSDETTKRAEALAQACLAKIELTAAKLQEHEVKTAAEVAALNAKVDAATRALIDAETRLAKAIE